MSEKFPKNEDFLEDDHICPVCNKCIKPGTNHVIFCSENDINPRGFD